MSNNDDTDQEWGRIMGNPENVIMSEALINKVDPYDLGEISPVNHVSADCELTFSGYTIVGTIIAFNVIKGIVSYSALVPAVEAFRMFSASPISSIKIYSYNDTLLFNEYPEGAEFDFEVEVQDGENAVLTISFPIATQ